MGPNDRVVFLVTVFVITMCLFVVWMFSGFNIEERKFKAILASFIVVMIFQFLIFDPIRFLIEAIDAACWPKVHKQHNPDLNAKRHNRMDYLNLRLSSLRSQLMITEKHRNEEINLKYRAVVCDLWMYGKVFVVIVILNVALDRSDTYYNYHSIQTLITSNTTKTLGLSEVLFLHQLYPFIEQTLINAFLTNDPHRLNSHWYNSRGTKLLGAIRIRLLRNTGQEYGLTEPDFSEEEYSHGWSSPHMRDVYTDKRWSMYSPWVPMKHSYQFWEDIFLGYKQYGYYTAYPELKGYEVTLRDTKDDSLKVLTHLYENNWLDVRTAAVFFDFTLYNADTDLFSVCSIRCENLPFGNILSSMDVSTVSMTRSPETLPWNIMIIFVAYGIIWLELGVVVIVPLWFEPKRLAELWVIVDLTILFLSISVLIMMGLKSLMTTRLMTMLEVASTHDFIDFRVPARLNECSTLTMGCLVTLVTLRLWKVMQFARMFQTFTMTLSLAWKALFSTACVILIFMMGFGIATVCINGNNKRNFRSMVQALASIMCFVFGFSSYVNPEDLFAGGKIVGIVIYAVMAFTISILLINVFVSLISSYFAAAKAISDRKPKDEISLWEFLRVEYADAIKLIRKTLRCQHKYRRSNRTVAENIKRKLALQERARASVRLKKGLKALAQPKWKKVREANEYERKVQTQHNDRISRTYTIAAILQTQLEIAERKLFGDRDGNLRDSDEGEARARQQNLSRQSED